jgi:aldehyde:ferredoxin oxidoreductase
MSRTGTILRVDLTEGKIEREPTARYARDYIGGPGIGSKLIVDNVPPDVAGTDPRNMLTINTGPLTGTLLGNKCDVTTKSPKIVNSPLVTASFGGQFASEMKFAGYDHIAITGKAPGPAYLFVNNGQVEIRNAKHLWGLDTEEVQVRIKGELKDPDVQIACIGPAGENQFVAAIILHDIQNAASQGGVGAVMGSKNLKAVAVRGTKGLKVADPDKCMALWNRVWEEMTTGRLRAYVQTVNREQLSTHCDEYAMMGMAQWGYGPDASFVIPKMKKEEFQGEFDRKYRVGSIGCAFCPVQCQGNYDVPGVGSGGVACFVNLAMRFGVKNLDTKLHFKAAERMQKLGADTIEVTGIAGWLMLLYQEGLITADDTDGVPMEWGSEEAIMTVIEKVCRQEGFGKFFARGIARAAEEMVNGRGFHLAYHERNVSIPLTFWERGVTLGGSGGTQLMQAATQYLWFHPPADRHGIYRLFAPIFGLSEEETLRLTDEWLCEFSEKHTGSRDAWKPEVVEGKARYMWATENAISAADMAGRCDGLTTRTPHAGCTWDTEDTAAAIRAATGERCTTEMLLEAIQRRRLLETSYNILCERMNGEVPEIPGALVRGSMEPIPDGPFKGQEWDEDASEQVGEDYCDLRGCDPDTGVPTREALEKVGLRDLADKLEASESGEGLSGESRPSQPVCPM